MSIRKRGPRAFQVRVSPFPAQTVPTRDAAKALELDLKLRRSLGDLYEQAPNTLADELGSFLDRKRASGGSRGKLRPRSLEFIERSLAIWRNNPRLSRLSLPQLRRVHVEDVVVTRAAEHPRSAKNELEQLKAALRDARARGQRVDPSIFAIPPVGHEARRGRALTVSELDELASWFPEHVKRLVLLAGFIGARQNVWFNLTDDLLDLDDGTLAIPRDLAKNRLEHRIYLTEGEVKLFREQLVARAVGTGLVFPTITGRPWNRSGFSGRVWRDAVAAVTAADRADSGRDTSVYDGFTFHMLRHTAGSLMALAGIDPAVASERLGHRDGGVLFLRRYRHLYEGEKRAQARKLDDLVKHARKAQAG